MPTRCVHVCYLPPDAEEFEVELPDDYDTWDVAILNEYILNAAPPGETWPEFWEFV